MKIAFIEKKEEIDVAEFDRIISFCKDGYSGIENYVILKDIIGVKNPAGSNLDSWLARHQGGDFRYKDVDLLQAYRLSIFGFFSNLAKKTLIIKRVIAKESPDEIWISKNNPKRDLRYPFLRSFLKDFIVPGINLKYFADNTTKEDISVVSFSRDNGYFFRLLLDAVRRFLYMFNRSKARSILIYSDLNKIPVLFDNLTGKNVIFLREELPESLLFYLFKRQIRIKLFSDFRISKKQRLEIEKASARILRNIDHLDESLSIWGINFTPYVKEYLTAIWKEELKNTLEMIERSHILLKRFNAKSLLLDEDKSISKNILAQLCEKYGVRSYVNCHGEPYYKVGYCPLNADKLLVWGGKQKDVFLRWGLEEKRIDVVGCAKYDKYLRTSSAEIKSKICRKFKLDIYKPLALIVPWPLSKRGDDIVENTIWNLNKQIVETIDSVKDVQILIKLHPSDQSESYFEDLSEQLNSNKIRVVKSYDSLSLTKGADLLVACITTMAVDGMAYNKPVILTDEFSVGLYKELDFFYDGTSSGKLKDAIIGIIDGSYNTHAANWQKAVDIVLNGMDGKVSKRIADILNKT